MKLYYNPKSRAAIAKWMLDECGGTTRSFPSTLKSSQHKTPEFLMINPAGKLLPCRRRLKDLRRRGDLPVSR